MPRLMIRCIATDQLVSTGMATDQCTWKRLPLDWVGEAFICPACHKKHAWIKSDAVLDTSRHPAHGTDRALVSIAATRSA
jgi:hypothetical protein